MKLRSCCKNNQRTELVRETTGQLNLVKIIDLGQQKSSRKRNKKKNTENKHEHESEVARLIAKFEEATGLDEARNKNTC